MYVSVFRFRFYHSTGILAIDCYKYDMHNKVIIYIHIIYSKSRT